MVTFFSFCGHHVAKISYGGYFQIMHVENNCYIEQYIADFMKSPVNETVAAHLVMKIWFNVRLLLGPLWGCLLYLYLY